MPALEPYVSVRFWGIVCQKPTKKPKYQFPMPDKLFRGWVNPKTGITPHHLGL
jgi:hypothetical protein